MGAAERLHDAGDAIPELDFLERERRSPFKHEYFQGVVTAMSGAGYRHGLVQANLMMALGRRLPAGCRTTGSDLRVNSPITSFYTYPDVVVVCGKPEFVDNRFDTLLNPALVAEILSPSTRKYDLGEKANRYRAIGSLRHYLLIDQATLFVQLHTRADRPGQWLIEDLTELTATLDLTALGIEVPVAELYEGIELDSSALRTA